MKVCTLLAFVASGIAASTKDITDLLKSIRNHETSDYFKKSEALKPWLTYAEIVQATKGLLESRKHSHINDLYARIENEEYRVYLKYYYGQVQGMYIWNNTRSALRSGYDAGCDSRTIKEPKCEAIILLKGEIREYMKALKNICVQETNDKNCPDIASVYTLLSEFNKFLLKSIRDLENLEHNTNSQTLKRGMTYAGIVQATQDLLESSKHSCSDNLYAGFRDEAYSAYLKH
ncbi:hypothetical protein DSO57_1002151 [Entomophthora muscae]|uniref:Uncharacterized protein n=1 Tax=Entomophthora muscae TaxID=34485 RepID=A0ACC2SLI6_9FUNG|nr:hypothetical protein DSO57_1002151 [Entomophthora muscae]